MPGGSALTGSGDEKDRVVVRENGQITYFASDVAYHLDKLERGFDRVIDIWGARPPRLCAAGHIALQALGGGSVPARRAAGQFAILYRGGQKAQMSTCSGEFITLRELQRSVAMPRGSST